MQIKFHLKKMVFCISSASVASIGARASTRSSRTAKLVSASKVHHSPVSLRGVASSGLSTTISGRGIVSCRAEGETPAGSSTPSTVPNTSLLVVGGTGTLGRQIVRRALDEGYDVRVCVRPRERPADFIRDWGASTVQCDLTDPATIPAALVGIHTVIDCATAR